ncbi:uncharacterized protein HD556DRAFT_1537108 [Suillus plorans]|uniref:PEP5/VPS11 N-terminal domain-containing protein n=1 Tax=Suillus plorans TaxID=116603 RepID=A0A9P7ALW3_9AGAM|nr:uncharacterized protein HD556DRAFT_1537108 [Suillus plorans]KAG1792048.1 hypothetical protein HD556DRAFT_1537108 [Suillus plorans]
MHTVKMIPFARASALYFLAIGLADGTVLLYRHPDQSLSSTTSLTTLPNTRIIHESSPESITGLSFREFPSPTNANAKDNNLHLFIVTTNSVYLYHVSGKGSRGSSVLLDDIGCGLGYVVMDWRAEKIVLARDEEVYAYGLQGRELPYGYEARVAGGDGDTSRVTVFDMENKALYPLALSLAQTQHLGESYVIFTVSTKGDWDGAMTYYLKTIDWLKPSYVVRKSMDAQRIHNLVTNLQDLHALGLTNADHSTLLLNNYIKLRDVARLDSFVQTESRRSGAAESNGDLSFDLDYIWEQPRRKATSPDNLLEETTQLLIGLCTGSGSFTIPETEDTTPQQSSTAANPLSYLALSRAPAPEDTVEESEADKEEDVTEP